MHQIAENMLFAPNFGQFRLQNVLFAPKFCPFKFIKNMLFEPKFSLIKLSLAINCTEFQFIGHNDHDIISV